MANEPNKDQTKDQPKDKEAAKETVSSTMMNVTCKLPHGLVLRLYDMVPGDDGKKTPVIKGGEVVLAGANASQIYGGFGLTQVPTDFWEEWVRQNKSLPALANGLLFAEPKRDRAIDRAEDQSDAKTGTEPLDPRKPGPGLQQASAKDMKEESSR